MHSRPASTRPMRCAIYTRKSVAKGLDDDVNSLEVQREICSAYICSQRHRSWTPMPGTFDDGGFSGFSGGSLDRPALKELLGAVEQGLVDVIVVYKLDRLTRSLSDFIRLVDLLDQYEVTFVSVTQSFDTQDSMGRLVLNILLTFAQFEREMLADRIWDKVHTMRRAGRWVGGAAPFGYDLVASRLVVNAAEADVIRLMHRRYLELGCSNRLTREMRELGVRSKLFTTRYGVQRGGVAATEQLRLRHPRQGARSQRGSVDHAPVLRGAAAGRAGAGGARRRARQLRRHRRAGVPGRPARDWVQVEQRTAARVD